MNRVEIDALTPAEFEALVTRINGEAAAMRLEARATLDQAHAQARKVVEGAKREAEKIVADGYRRLAEIIKNGESK